jgi:hypothetical protein
LTSRDICMTSPDASSFPCLTPHFIFYPSLRTSIQKLSRIIPFVCILFLFNQTFTNCFNDKSILCLKHLRAYVIASEGILAEQKSLCFEPDGDTDSYRMRKRYQEDTCYQGCLCFPPAPQCFLV